LQKNLDLGQFSEVCPIGATGRPVMGVGMAGSQSVESRTVWVLVGGVRERLRGENSGGEVQATFCGWSKGGAGGANPTETSGIAGKTNSTNQNTFLASRMKIAPV